MNKVLISVEIPKLSGNYNILVPVNKKIGFLKKIIIDLINLNNVDALSLRLLEKYTGNELNSDLFVYQSNIKNGSILVLI